MRKSLSPLTNLVNNYTNYNFMIVIVPRAKGLIVERANYKNIYIYYIDRGEYDFIFLYNKSNKFYRFMIRNDKDTKNFTLVNEFLDNKVRDYFLFDEFDYINRDEYEFQQYDIDIMECLKRLDT